MKDQTKVNVFNAENPETEVQDKVSYTITFPNLAVDDGEPYTVFTVSSEDFVLDCMEGQNSPLNRPEFVDISVSEGLVEMMKSKRKTKNDDPYLH